MCTDVSLERWPEVALLQGVIQRDSEIYANAGISVLCEDISETTGSQPDTSGYYAFKSPVKYMQLLE